MAGRNHIQKWESFLPSDFIVSADRKVFGLSQGERGRNPAFSAGGATRLGKKAGFLCLIFRKLFDLLSLSYNKKYKKFLIERNTNESSGKDHSKHKST
ncbi:Uncharacterized protein dnm_082300 [Desulfonema magnum]|uniref:Uncharacterized protein n=1 Tax=Desulfonema magnum TaxID=45655 RepID=A0A975BVU1_9BACT|nr:Uncharacterized protein dnm_082300 [Desulfonema magnum]